MQNDLEHILKNSTTVAEHIKKLLDIADASAIQVCKGLVEELIPENDKLDIAMKSELIKALCSLARIVFQQECLARLSQSMIQDVEKDFQDVHHEYIEFFRSQARYVMSKNEDKTP